MSDVVHILRSPGKRHWVKCILGLDELGIAILPYIQGTFRRYYDRHFWDYHHLGCTLNCQHDHFYHLGHGPSDPCIRCYDSTNHSHHHMKCNNDCKHLYSSDFEQDEPVQCNLEQGMGFPESFAEWKLSKRLDYSSCYHHITCIEKQCKHDSCSCQGIFNELVEKHEKIHNDDVCCHIKRKGKDWFLETKPQCTACESAFELLKKLVNDPKNKKNIYWRNATFPKDFRDSWQLAKVFMPSGNTNTDDPTKVDPVALLTVMNNCRLFNVDTDLIDKIISKRNGFVHIGSQKERITTEQTDEFFGFIIRFLTSLKYVYDCQNNIATIEKIKEREVTAEMFTKANATHVQCLLNTLSERTSSGEDISSILKDVECAILDKADPERDEKERLKRIISGQEKMIDSLLK